MGCEKNALSMNNLSNLRQSLILPWKWPARLCFAPDELMEKVVDADFKNLHIYLAGLTSAERLDS